MTSQDNAPEAPSPPAGRKPRRRAWLRWIAAICGLVIISLSAALYWRVPLANAALEFGLGRAGLHNADVTVTALSGSHIHLAGLRLGDAIEVKEAGAVFDLWRLPENPVTRVTIDGLSADLADARRTLAEMSQDEPGGADTAPPPTLRSLVARVAGLPDITVRNISLTYGGTDGTVTASGSVAAARTEKNAYRMRFGMELSGRIDGGVNGTPQRVAIDGTTDLTPGSATLDLRATADEGALAGALEASADLSSDPAVFTAATRLETGNLATLAALLPDLEAAGGSLKVDARTISPMAFGLDTPLGLPALTAALQKSGGDGIRLEAVVKNAFYGDRYKGIDGTVSAALRRIPDANDRLQADGTLALRAARAGTADISVTNAFVTGAYRLLRDENALTLSLPDGMRVTAAQFSSGDGAVAVAPIDVTLTAERARIHGQEGRRQTDVLLGLTLGATRLSLAGKPDKRHFRLAPLTLRLTGTADGDGGLQARVQTPRLSVSERNRAGALDRLDISVRRARAGVTGRLRGRVSATENGTHLLRPTPLTVDLSLKRHMLTFSSKAVLPGANAATATGRHDLSTGRGNAVLEVPAFRMTPGGGEFRALAPSVSSIDIQSGTVRANARLTWSAKGIDGTGEFAVDALNFTDPSSGTTVQGLSADIRLDRLIPPRTPPGQALRVKRVDAGVALNDLLLRFALIDGTVEAVPAVRIETFRTGFAGGHLGLTPTVIDSGTGAVQATVRVERVDLSALLAAVGLDNISGTGRLNGILPVRTAGDAVGIAGGRLAASKPGTLRIRSEAAKRALSQGGTEVTLMLSALEDFRYETLTLDIEKEITGQGRVVLRTRGQNPAVRDGQPFVINLTLTGNVDGLAAVLAQALQLPGGVVRSMLAK